MDEYEEWGVLFPWGNVVSYDTEREARELIAKVNGQVLVKMDGTKTKPLELVLVHRFVPDWRRVPE